MNGEPMQQDLYGEIVRILRAGGIEEPELEARWITQDIPDAAKALHIARRRAQHEPLQYLLGTWEFYGLPMLVGKGVLIPRADTETLVDAVLMRTEQIAAPRIVDLCTGSGCIALALKSQRQNAVVTGIEQSPEALQYAQKNAAACKLDITLLHADVLHAQTAARHHELDVVVSNPPYLTAEDMLHLQQEVTHEPALALAGGADGLHFSREITRLWKQTLKPNGLLAYEVGYAQAEAVRAILADNGFTEIETVRDLNGMERVVLGRAI